VFITKLSVHAAEAGTLEKKNLVYTAFMKKRKVDTNIEFLMTGVPYSTSCLYEWERVLFNL
jgi:hypothetical protein